MIRRIQRSHEEPKREGLSWDERWKGEDNGLITCLEVGHELREKDLALSIRVENGELPVLRWEEGVEKKTKKCEKYRTLFYLAQRQDLRGDDLGINLSQEPEMISSRTGMRVIYTGNIEKYGKA